MAAAERHRWRHRRRRARPLGRCNVFAAGLGSTTTAAELAQLAHLARGLCPDEWAAEQQLAEELDLIDVEGFAALCAGAPSLSS